MLRVLQALFFLMIAGIASFLIYRMFVDPGYAGDFDPSSHSHQIVVVNCRAARHSGCTPKARSAGWPSTMDPDPKERFAKKVKELGATAGAAGMLEIDRELVELSIDIAIDDKAIDKAIAGGLRQDAERQLFKPNARSFVLMHNYDQPLIMDGEEPALLASVRK